MNEETFVSLRKQKLKIFLDKEGLDKFYQNIYFTTFFKHGMHFLLKKPYSMQVRSIDSNYAQISRIISRLQTSLHTHRIATSWYGNHCCFTTSLFRCHSNIPPACAVSPSCVISFPPSNAPFCSLGEER
jgi:hypothetical protein